MANAYSVGINGGDATSNMIKVYCSPSGNDSTGTGAIGNPYETIQKALAVIAQDAAQRRVIYLAAGTYDAGSSGVVFPHILGEGDFVFADHAVLGSADYGDLTIEGALVVDLTLSVAHTTWTQRANKAALYDLKDSTHASMTLNQYRGFMLVDDDGNQAVIFGNETDGTLHVLAAGPFGGSALQIVHPGAIVQVTDASSYQQAITLPPASCSVVLRGIQLASHDNTTHANQNAGFFDLGASNSRLELMRLTNIDGSSSEATTWVEGCYFAPENGATGIGQVSMELTNVHFECYASYIYGQHHMLGTGMPAPATFGVCFVEEISSGFGYGFNQSFAGPTPWDVGNCEFKDTSLVARGPGLFKLLAATVNGISSESASTSPGIVLREGAFMNIAAVDGVAGDHGMEVHPGCNVFWNPTSMPTITGTNGDVQIGDAAILPWYYAECTKFQFSPADYIKAAGGIFLGVSFSNGIEFLLKQPRTIKGGRFWYPGGYALTVKVSLWDDAGTRVASGTVAVSAAGYYSVIFSSPVAMPSNKRWSISTWDVSGTYVWYQGKSAVDYPATPFFMGDQVMMTSNYAAAYGDTAPSTGWGGGYVGSVEPLIVPAVWW
jgi:Domain of unknown function (DUF4082)/Protein of unknown function (DUF1565)